MHDPRRILLEPRPVVEAVKFEVPTTHHLALHGFAATYQVDLACEAAEPGKAHEVYEALRDALIGQREPSDDEAIHRGSAYVELQDPTGTKFVATMLAAVPTWPAPTLRWPPECDRISIPSRFAGPEYYDLTVPGADGARRAIECDWRPWRLVAHFARPIDRLRLGFWIYGVPQTWPQLGPSKFGRPMTLE